jgi:hypothetical protein
VVSNPDKKQIRIAAEEEELESYESHVEDWLDDLKPLQRLAQTLLETAPYLIIVLDVFMSLPQMGKRKTIITFRKVLA